MKMIKCIFGGSILALLMLACTMGESRADGGPSVLTYSGDLGEASLTLKVDFSGGSPRIVGGEFTVELETVDVHPDATGLSFKVRLPGTELYGNLVRFDQTSAFRDLDVEFNNHRMTLSLSSDR